MTVATSTAPPTRAARRPNEGSHTAMRASRRLLALLVIPTLAATAACGGDATADPAPAAAKSSSDGDAADETFDDLTGRDTVVVQARDNSFVSQHVTISAGTEVTFDNRGRNPHNAVPVEEGAFEEVATDGFQPGSTATVAFDEPGDYPYYCTLHGTETAGMVGTIRVVD